jgi:hypothetical protein
MKSENVSSEVASILGALGDMEKQLVDSLFPEMLGSGNPGNHIRLATARTLVHRFSGNVIAPFVDIIKAWSAHTVEAKHIVAKFREQLLEKDARISALSAELRAAQDQRGIYESKKVSELEIQLANRDRTISDLSARLAAAEKSGAELRAEITGRNAAVAGYERDIGQLMTANIQANTSRNNAVMFIAEAIAKIRERWPKLSPYLELIIADLEQARAELISPATTVQNQHTAPLAQKVG